MKESVAYRNPYEKTKRMRAKTKDKEIKLAYKCENITSAIAETRTGVENNM